MSEYPIIEQVALIIGKHLASGQSIALPGIGTLYIRQREARKISKRMIEPPCRFIDFSSKEQGVTLPELIAVEAECDADNAAQIYERWRNLATEGDQIKILGIGTLAHKHFSMERSFDQRLNPHGHAPVSLKSRHRFDWVTLLGIVAIVVALTLVGLQFFGQDLNNNPLKAWFDSWGAQTEEPHTPATDPTEVTKDAEVTEVADTPEQTKIEEPTTADSSTGTEDPTAPAIPSDESEKILETPTRPVEVAPATEPEQQSEDPLKMVSKRNYVVYGVFSTIENARRAVESLRKQAVPQTGTIYYFGSKYMVSPFASDDEAACRAYIQEQQGTMPNIWIHTAR